MPNEIVQLNVQVIILEPKKAGLLGCENTSD